MTDVATPTPTPPLPPAKKQQHAAPHPPKPIRLVGEQGEHRDRLRAILRRSPFALDLSALGCGKTYTGSAIALGPPLLPPPTAEAAEAAGAEHAGPAEAAEAAGASTTPSTHTTQFSKVIVLAPLSVLGKWAHMRTAHGVPLTHELSYCQLRGTTGRQPGHGLLRRAEVEDRATGTVRIVYTATPAYEALVREGVLLIADEVQNVKNANTQSLAFHELVRAVVADFEERGPAAARSRVLLMSGTPFDRQEQVVRLLRGLRICRGGGALCTFNPRTYRWQWGSSMHDVVRYCRALDAPAVGRVLHAGGVTGDSHCEVLHQACYALFQEVVKPAVSSEMAPPVQRAKLHKANAFFEIQGDSKEALERSVRELEEAAAYDPATRTVSSRGGGASGGGAGGGSGGGPPRMTPAEAAAKLGRISLAMMRVEAAKLGAMACAAAERLGSFADAKVVLCVNYSDSIGLLRAALAGFRPLVLHGAMSCRARTEAVRLFQEPDARHRLLIANTRTCSTGIDLDDKHGEFPRYCIASPTYSVIDIHQLGHRFLRLDTQSDAVLHLVYGRHASELGVLNALAAKTEVLKDTAGSQVQCGVVFPGDYPRYDVAEAVRLLRARRYGDVDWSDPSHALVREFQPFLRARRVIRDAAERALLDPRFAWCRRRLQREFYDL